MSTSGHALFPPGSVRAPAAAWLAPAIFSATAFLSAALLFAIQPMFTKLALPRLGGSSSVWSVAVVFFETALLAGYAYAHFISRVLSPARAALVHVLALATVALTLPIGIVAGFERPPSDWVSLWVFGLFGVSIGLPFAVLSASAPLLQNWFALSGGGEARNPFVLYAASNLGSFTGLLTYPFVLEPLLPLTGQTRLWSAGFVGFALLLICAAVFAVRAPSGRQIDAAKPREAAPSLSRRLAWIALAAVPCGLVIAVTAHIGMDVAAAPFLWVVPLALYLLTFVAVFRDRPWIDPAIVARIAPIAVTARIVAPFALLQAGLRPAAWLAMMALDLLAFAALTLLCHGELYRLRPGAGRATEYYLFIALGGAVGGGVTGLVAPWAFSGTYEYPILMTAALLALPGLFDQGYRAALREAAPVLLTLLAGLALWWMLGRRIPSGTEFAFTAALALLGAYMLTQTRRPARFVALAALALAAIEVFRPGLGLIEASRSFFGVYKVADSADGTHRFLFHGTTIHGVERVRDRAGARLRGRPEPLAYYYEGGPIWEGVDAVRKANGGLDRVAVVGLGVGSMACHRRAGETWTFFEIDPEVVRLAHDPQRFRFMAECAPQAPIVVGDARLTLAAASERYDVIALDSFTSDAIPSHLLTREALRVYLDRLTPRGVIVAHVSNRHLDLAPVIAATAAAEGLQAWRRDDDAKIDFAAIYRAPAKVAVLARDPGHVGEIATGGRWERLRADAKVAAWSDDYSNLLGAIWRKKFGP